MKATTYGTILLLVGWLGAPPSPAHAQNPANVTQLIRDSQAAAAEGKADEAERLARGAVDLDPAHPPAWRQYGVALLRGAKHKEAAAAFQRAVEMDEKDATAWRGLGQAHWQSGQQNEAVRALGAYLRLKPEDAPAWRDLAAWLTRLERGDQAVAALERAVALKPDDASAWRELGAWQLRLQRPDAAAAALERVTALKPEDPGAWRELASVRTRLGKLDEASEAFEKATRLDPGQAGAWRDWASVLAKLGRDEAAAAALERVVKLTPNDAAAWRELASALTRLDKTEPAVAALEQALRLAPKDAAAWRALAVLHQRAGRAADAAKTFEQALAAKPDDPATQRDLGWLLWTQGRRDQALARLAEAVAGGIDARDRVIFQVVARLSEEGAGDQALAFLRKVAPNETPASLGLALARAGRLRAAEPILSGAWKGGDQSADVGLYLAYSRAVNGQFAGIAAYLEPLFASGSVLSPERADLALEALRLGSTRPETPALVSRLEAAAATGGRFSERVTDILETAAEARRVGDEPSQALSLYRRVLERDPNRASWTWAVLLAERVEGQTPFAWLAEYEKRASSPARAAGIKGLRAERQGRLSEAVPALRESLALDPKQPPLRQLLFGSLLSLGRGDEARAEAGWFAKQVDAGEATLRSYLAEMLTRLGDTREALAHWELLHQANPDVPYYGLETANALYRLNRPDEAMDLLRAMADAGANHQVYELMAEIATARARTAEAVEWAERGLAAAPSQGLLRYRAEGLEKLGTNAPAALADATEYLKKDPGNVPMTLLAGRQIEALNRTNEATAFHEAKLASNAAFVPSLVALRDRVTRDGDIDRAVGYSRARLAVQPDSPEALRAYANSLAQQDHFRDALQTLRPLAKTPLEKAVPVLVYQSVTPHPYAGRNRVSQIARHVQRLAEDGYVFITAFSQLAEKPDARHVMLVIDDPDAEVIEALDPVLQRHGARVVYAGNAAFPTVTRGGEPLPARLAPLLASGRWRLASGGPDAFQRGVVNAAGTLGNPLTHSLVAAGAPESADAFQARVDRALAGSARALEREPERILVYPAGDFGQRSLDTDTNHVAALRESVARHFTHAIYFDDSGFFLTDPAGDPLRVPARVVPADWDEAALAAYLGAGHPLARARLELARVLYWNGQHEDAYAAFAEAQKAGADSRELIFNWGMNADRQGDLPTARTLLLAAQALNPEDERIAKALARIEDLRRPQATLFLSGWRDNEDRDHYRYGAYGDFFVSERVRLGLLADRDRWSTDGVGTEYGTRYGVRGLAYLAPEIWLSGSLWQLDMDDLKDHWGGDLALRLPNPLLSGTLTLTASREEIETVEALRKNIDANTFALRTYTRLRDRWDLFADLSQTDRSDGNDTTMLDGRLLYRLQEWPYLAAGWRFRFADSDRDPPEYWAPEGLQQHQAHLTIRGAKGKWSYAASAEAGYAKERDTSWRFVWGAKGNVDYAFTRRVSLAAELGYFESPDYNRLYGRLGLTGRF